MKHFLIVTFLTLQYLSVVCCELKKCCKLNERLENIEDEFKCIENSSSKLQILTTETDFLRSQTTGQCVDIIEDFYSFNASHGNVAQYTRIKEDFFPKCCPLNFVYNSKLHACKENKDADYSFLNNNTFFKVGLPGCQIIVDSNTTYIATDKTNTTNTQSTHSYCFDRNEEGAYVKRECKDIEESEKLCNNTRCIKKCCPDGQFFVDSDTCAEDYTFGMNLSDLATRKLMNESTNNYATIFNNSCVQLSLLKDENYFPTLYDNGTFRYQMETVAVIDDTYCIEYSKKDNPGSYLFYICVDRSDASLYNYFSYLLLLSAIFLVVTVVVYVVLGEYRKLFGKILINYSVAVFIWFAQMAYQYIGLPVTGCLSEVILLIFSRTASFLWSNIMCWDIWTNFSSRSGYKDSFDKLYHLKKIAVYMVYGWGMPSCLVLLIYIFYKNPILPEAIQPHLAENQCTTIETIPGNFAAWLFVDVPTIIIQIINIILFIMTVVYCIKVKNQINRITSDYDQKQTEKNKAQLYLVLKLMIIMGITFVFEVATATSAVQMSELGEFAKYTEVVFNMINAAQGILIFIILVCNKRIYKKIKKSWQESTTTATNSGISDKSRTP